MSDPTDDSRARDTIHAPPEDDFQRRKIGPRVLSPFVEIPGAPEWANMLYRRDHEERSIVLEAIQGMRADQRRILANQETQGRSISTLRTSTEARFEDQAAARDELEGRVQSLEDWRAEMQGE